MLTDMKEQMKEQQAQSDRDWERVTLDRENVIGEQEALRRLNNRIQAQIAALNCQDLCLPFLWGDFGVRVPKEVLDFNFWLLLQNEWRYLAHQAF